MSYNAIIISNYNINFGMKAVVRYSNGKNVKGMLVFKKLQCYAAKTTIFLMWSIEEKKCVCVTLKTGCGEATRVFFFYFFFFYIFWNNIVSTQTETHINAHRSSCSTPTHICKQPNTPTLLQTADAVRLVVMARTFTPNQSLISVQSTVDTSKGLKGVKG